MQNHGIMKCSTQVKQLNTMCTRKDATSSSLKYEHADCRDLFRRVFRGVHAQRYDFTQSGTTYPPPPSMAGACQQKHVRAWVPSDRISTCRKGALAYVN